ncbi:hypothetical protein V5O48_013280 [Marasmius crinis-equi]|uniref:F-box domain-containing protein n=1 Tax=Marasmius crinis-equi TaxID=585013 RepID=A0ABR3F0H3_9AGAR
MRSGNALNEQQVGVEQELLLCDEKQLQRLDSTIAFHEALLGEMYTGQAFLRNRIWLRKALKAPIHRVPTEVIQEILVLACSEETQDWAGKPVFPVAMFGHYDRNAPNNLAQVCVRWHQIVRNTPVFWQALTIRTPRTDLEQRRLRQTLALSGSHSLKLAIDRGAWPLPFSSLYAPLVQAFARTSELHVDYGLIMEENFDRVVDWRMLKRLFLHVRGVHGGSEPRPFSQAQLTSLIKAPGLERLWTNSFTELANQEMFPPGTLLALECGEGGTIQLRYLRELLRRCPGLRSLSVNVRFSHEGQAIQEPIVLAEVERLAYHCESSQATIFLDLLTARFLTELVLPIDPSDDIWSHVIDFVDRSECRLRSLDCSLPWSFTDNSSGWSSLFARLVNLTTLTVKVPLNVSWTGQSALDVLCNVLSGGTSGGAPLLTMLQSFQVATRGGDWKDVDHVDTDRIAASVIRFAEVRSPQNQDLTVVPLRNVCLLLESRQGWGDQARVPVLGRLGMRREALVSAGMNCVVSFAFI